MTAFAWMIALAILAAWFVCAVPLAAIIARLLGGEPPMPPPDPADGTAFDKHVELALWIASQDPDITVNDVAEHIGLLELRRDFAEWESKAEAVGDDHA